MKIAVLNGSPKGMTSVTMQYVLFLQKKSPQHTFQILNVCHDIRKLEEDEGAFREVVGAIQAADAVLWATPVYVLLVPGPYKRFIELVFERSAAEAFAGKYAAAITTSVRFYDHTAHEYLHAVCDDLEMQWAGSYSAEMYDLLKEQEQKRLFLFWTDVLRAIESRLPTQRCYDRIAPNEFTYEPGAASDKRPATGKKIVVLSDARQQDANLRRMVDRFTARCGDPVEVVNLHEIAMRGGCQGCIHCSFDNVCIYRDTDDVCEAYRKIMAADIVVEAAVVKDRFLSARWKTFWDRGFFNNHIPVMAGKQLAYLVSGPLTQLAGLREILTAAADVEQVNLAGIVSDERVDSAQLDRLIDALADRLGQCAAEGYLQPGTFLGKGGRKVLRDEIWGGLRFAFPMDHRYYRRHGLYDFPRRSLITEVKEAFFSLMLKIPSFRKEFQNRMREGMIEPLAAVVEKA